MRDKETNQALSYHVNKEEVEEAKRLDGIFVLVTSQKEIEKSKVVDSYKNLQEVEILFDDFINFGSGLNPLLFNGKLLYYQSKISFINGTDPLLFCAVTHIRNF